MDTISNKVDNKGRVSLPSDYRAIVKDLSSEIVCYRSLSLPCIEGCLEETLDKLAADIEDSHQNTTRFLVMSREPLAKEPKNGEKFKTAMVFRVKNIPSALFWALGCFAREGLNLTKIESYLVDGGFITAQFYAEVEAHQNQEAFKQALANLKSMCETIHVLGSYPAGLPAV